MKKEIIHSSTEPSKTGSLSSWCTLITYMLISPDSPGVSTGPNTKPSSLIRKENLPFPALQIQEINLHT